MGHSIGNEDDVEDWTNDFAIASPTAVKQHDAKIGKVQFCAC